MDRNNELLLRVARLYHVQSETMDAIAHQLGVSRSTVSRLLKEARDRGLVRVSIVDPESSLGYGLIHQLGWTTVEGDKDYVLLEPPAQP